MDPLPKVDDSCAEYFRRYANVRTTREMIGKGAYGTVYSLGHRRRTTPRPVAHPELVPVRQPSAVKVYRRFDSSVIREIFFLKTLECTGMVPRLLEVSASVLYPYILMEKFDSNLSVALTADPTLVREAIVTLLRLLVVLSEMTPYPCVHRDIKAANVLVTGRRVVVCDFGIARQLPHGFDLICSKESIPTADMQPLATSAPEVLFRMVRYGCPIDVWSIGALLCHEFNDTYSRLARLGDRKRVQVEFCNFFGLPPRAGKLRTTIQESLPLPSPIPDGTINPCVLDGLTEFEKILVQKCMVVDPRKRPTARELAEEMSVPLVTLPRFVPEEVDLTEKIDIDTWHECMGEIFVQHRFGFVAVEYFRMGASKMTFNPVPRIKAQELLWLARAAVGLNCLFISDPDMDLSLLIPDIPERLGEFTQHIWDLFITIGFEMRTWSALDRIYWCGMTDIPSDSGLAACCFDGRWRNSRLHSQVVMDALTYHRTSRDGLACSIPRHRYLSLMDGMLAAREFFGESPP